MGLENWNTLEELREQIALRSADPSDLYGKLKDKLIYSSYAEDRIECLNEIWDEELYADCLSAQGYINQQVKNLDDKTSEEETGTLVHHLDRLADYILRASFDNEEDREQYEKLKIEKAEVRKISNLDLKKKRDLEVRDKQKSRPGLLSNYRESQTKFQHVRIEAKNRKVEEDEIGEPYDANSEKKSSTHYTFSDKELNQQQLFKNSERYWEHYGQHNNAENSVPSIFSRVDHTVKHPNFAYEDLSSRESSIKELEEVLSKGDCENEKELRNLLKDYKEEYKVATQFWRQPMSFKSSKIKMEILDPKVQIERRIVYTDKELVKELVYSFSELYEIHKGDPTSLFWSILMDMRRMLNVLSISEIQRTIIEYVYEHSNWKLKEIQEEISINYGRQITHQTVSYHIDKFIEKINKYYIEKELSPK